MAAAAHTIQLTVNEKIPVGKGRALYLGTAEGGTGYETGGVAVAEEPTNSRYSMPARFDNLNVQGLLVSQWTPKPQLLKLLANNTVTAKKSGFVEYENGETMATLVPAGTPFWGIGLA